MSKLYIPPLLLAVTHCTVSPGDPLQNHEYADLQTVERQISATDPETKDLNTVTGSWEIGNPYSSVDWDHD